MATVDLRGSAGTLALAHNGGSVRLDQSQGKIALGLVVGQGPQGPKGDKGDPGSGGGETYLAGSDGTTDAAPYFQAAFDSGATDIHLKPGGTYRILTPVTFANTNPRASVSIHGENATITVDRSAGTLPKASTFISPDTRWAFFDNVTKAALNTTSVNMADSATKATGSSNPSRSRLIFDGGIVVDGLASDVGLYYGHTSAPAFRRIRLYRMKYGGSWYGYADGAVLDQVHIVAPVTGGWALKQEANGDGVLISHCKGVGAGIWNAINCNSGKVVGAVAGGFSFQSCKSIVIDASHQELDEAGAYGTTFTLDRTAITIRDQFAYLGKGSGRYVVNVNDASSDPMSASDVTIDGGTSVYYMRTSETDPARDPGIYVTAANNGFKLRVRHLREIVNAQAEGSSARFREGVSAGSAVTAIANAFAAGADQMATGSFDFSRRDGVWQVRAPFGAALASRNLTSPSVAAALDANVVGVLVNGTTYEYVTAAKSSVGYSALSSTSSVAANANGTIGLDVTNPSGDCVLAIWRKSGTGVTSTPDRYLEVPLNGFTSHWYDTGTHLNGRTWQTTGIPTPTSVAAATTIPSRLNGMGLAVGQATMDRRDAGSGSSTISSGSVRFTYMVASRSETINTVRLITGSTAAAGLTLARVGIYSVDGRGNLTLVASTPSDTALFAAANTAYSKVLSASLAVTEGSLYAVGVMVVGTTGPAILGDALSTAASQFTNVFPPIVTGMGSQADLPASVTAGGVSAQTVPLYTELLP